MGRKTYDLIRWVLALVFIYSGITKFADLNAFAVIIDAYGFLPEFFTYPIAVSLSMFEVTAGAGLLLDLRGSLPSVFGMLIMFIGILGYGIMMGLDVDCGCFGPDDPEARAYAGLRPALYRDIVMVTGVIYLYLFRFTQNVRSVPVTAFMAGYRK